MELKLISVRFIDQDQAREQAFGDVKSLEENLAIGLLNPEDFKNLKLIPSLNLRISNEYGEIIVRGIEDDTVPCGLILLSVSIWCNQLTGVEANEFISKNINVIVEATNEAILSFNDIIKSIKSD